MKEAGLGEPVIVSQSTAPSSRLAHLGLEKLDKRFLHLGVELQALFQGISVSTIIKVFIIKEKHQGGFVFKLYIFWVRITKLLKIISLNMLVMVCEKGK